MYKKKQYKTSYIAHKNLNIKYKFTVDAEFFDRDSI